jgi:hypothetical protein
MEQRGGKVKSEVPSEDRHGWRRSGWCFVWVNQRSRDELDGRVGTAAIFVGFQRAFLLNGSAVSRWEVAL